MDRGLSYDLINRLPKNGPEKCLHCRVGLFSRAGVRLTRSRITGRPSLPGRPIMRTSSPVSGWAWLYQAPFVSMRIYSSPLVSQFTPS